jgi:hypothetical protein
MGCRGNIQRNTGLILNTDWHLPFVKDWVLRKQRRRLAGYRQEMQWKNDYFHIDWWMCPLCCCMDFLSSQQVSTRLLQNCCVAYCRFSVLQKFNHSYFRSKGIATFRLFAVGFSMASWLFIHGTSEVVLSLWTSVWFLHWASTCHFY